MNEIKKIIKEELIEPEINKKSHSTVGYIVGYDRYYNKATVEYFNPNTGDKVRQNNVSLKRPERGFHPVEPEPGDKVMLIFEMGDISMPKVVEIFNNDFGNPGGIRDEIKSAYGANLPDALGEV